MKKIAAIISAALVSLAMCAPALSGCSGDGIKFTLSKDGTHYTVKYSGISSPMEECRIPAYYGDDNIPVTGIADEGFANTRFTKIIIPKTVTEIGVAAFSYCPLLKTVEFEEGIQLEKLSHGMFGASTNLEEIKIPDSVKSLENLAFYGCSKLSSVTMNSVETIGDKTFEGCTALEEISLPSTLTTIGTLAFYRSGLKSVEIPESVKDTVTTDDDGNESTVYGLGIGSFNSCVYLESVKIAEGVKVIPSGIFGNCRALKEIYLPLSIDEVQGPYYEKGVFIVGHAFYYCPALTDVYYAGSEEQWKYIKIENLALSESGITMDNSALVNAAKHYENKYKYGGKNSTVFLIAKLKFMPFQPF